MRLLLRVLGAMDLMTSLVLALMATGVLPYWAYAPFALDLLAKGVVFTTGEASMLDLVTAAYIVLYPLLGFWLISVVMSLYLCQKGLLSFL